MEVSDKAQELHKKFLNKNLVWVDEENFYSSPKKAAECAIIAVDEILDLFILEFKWDKNHNGNIIYWQEVKEELEVLKEKQPA